MKHFDNPDLAADPAAARYVKTETVGVRFATADGELTSREGPNRYCAGDALVTGSTGDRWSVTRERFDSKYAPADGQARGADGRYRALPVPVLARQVYEPFTVARRAGGDVLTGAAGDWLLQYPSDNIGVVKTPPGNSGVVQNAPGNFGVLENAAGDFGVVENARFARVYRPI